jgi:putative component of membrane protein insertase Oxa1/YidC/SpoIIIJ protein YidD
MYMYHIRSYHDLLLSFIVQTIHGVDPADLAVLGAVALMCASEPKNVRHALESVEWDVLIFFAALFIIVEVRACAASFSCSAYCMHAVHMKPFELDLLKMRQRISKCTTDGLVTKSLLSVGTHSQTDSQTDRHRHTDTDT